MCASVCVCVCVGRRACLQLFTYDGFSTQDDPPALSFSPHVALCSAQLSLSSYFPLYFSFPPLSPHVCLPFMPQTFHPLLHRSPPPLYHHHHHYHQASPATMPPLFTSPHLEVSRLYSGLTSNGCVSPPFSRFLIQPSKLCSAIAHPTTQSPLMSGKPVGIRVLLLIISFTGNPHRPRRALGWQGE